MLLSLSSDRENMICDFPSSNKKYDLIFQTSFFCPLHRLSCIGNLKGSFFSNLFTMITQLTSSVSITDCNVPLFAISNTILDIINHRFFSLVVYLNTISNKKSKLVPIHFNFGRVNSFCGSDFPYTSVLLK